MSDNSSSHILNKPETATVAPRVLKKRGRKGNKIVTAFAEIPAIPADFEQYAADHQVSTNVMRQIKRHDQFPERGKVFVRKNKETKKMMIWREAPATES